jgi:hypothetical protein
MFGSHVLEAAAGLVLTYLAFSVFASSLNEWIAALLDLRARDLETALKNLLAEDLSLTPQPLPVAQAATATAGASSSAASPAPDPAIPAARLASALLAHPVVNNLSTPRLLGKGSSRPSYLEPHVFSTALFDLLVPGGPHSHEQIRNSVERLSNARLRATLLPIINRVPGDLEQARKNVEAWFNHAMEQISGRYKRRAQTIVFCIGLALSAALNVDSLRTAKRLWNDQFTQAQAIAATQQQVIAAQERAKAGAGANSAAPNSSGSVDPIAEEEAQRQAMERIINVYSESSLPFGWTHDSYRTWQPWNANLRGKLLCLLGWFFTGLAISFGAPFWFDLLNKTIGLNTRLNTGKPA